MEESSNYPIEKIDLPELIDLPVFRDRFISQERVDEICNLIWEKRPVFIKELVFFDVSGCFDFFDRRDFGVYETLPRIECFLEEEINFGNIEDISNIQMVDVLYEIERRVRKVLELEELIPMGEPISENPRGPFPPPEELDLYIWGYSKPGLVTRSLQNLSKRELDDLKKYFEEVRKKPRELSPTRKKAYEILYKENPELVFAYAEAQRRWLAMSSVGCSFRWHLKRVEEVVEGKQGIVKLVDMPVYRDTYISQEWVDLICKLLWEKGHPLISTLEYCSTKEVFVSGRVNLFDWMFKYVKELLNLYHEGEDIANLSDIQIIDVMYEVERRVRKVLGVEELKPMGEAIADGIEGPFPPPEELNLHIWGYSKPGLANRCLQNISKKDLDDIGWYEDKSKKPLSPVTKKAFEVLYKENPELVYTYAEAERRWFMMTPMKERLEWNLKRIEDKIKEE